jgi:hypothetical protein
MNRVPPSTITRIPPAPFPGSASRAAYRPPAVATIRPRRSELVIRVTGAVCRWAQMASGVAGSGAS